MIHRFGWRFGGLYWRLTVSYFLVTLVVVLVIIGAGTLLTHLSDFEQSHQQAQRRVQLDVALHPEQVAPTQQVAPYLEQTAPDREALQRWVIPRVLAYLQENSNNEIPLVAILDRNAGVLASGGCTGGTVKTMDCASSPALPMDATLASPQAQAAIRAALAGDAQPADTSATTADGDALDAAPVRAYDGRVLGALVVVFAAPDAAKGDGGASLSQGISAVVSSFLSIVGSVQFYFVLLAIGIGTLSGVLLSRSLTRRLRGITWAADAWSRGELGVAVRDRSRDEIGQLARRLNRMAEQLRTLLATREQLAVVEERNRLARELHDSVKQHVFANALLVRSARKIFARDPAQAERHLAEAEELAGQAQQELSDLIRALRPAALADKGLAAVLREYVGDWSRRTGLAADLRVQGERATPLDAEEALLRVAQEALANVARHSGALAVAVRLVWEENGVCLSVRDDGRGFDLAQAEGKGLGLASMRERVAALGGTLRIVPVSGAADGGTSVEACVPLAPSNARDAHVEGAPLDVDTLAESR
jgi:NarL family two-component system sensor histidine kinase LiaS